MSSDETSTGTKPDENSLRGEPGVVPLHEPIWREMQEPRDGLQPTPTWLIFFFMAVLGWCGWYLGTYDGQFRSDAYFGAAQGAGGPGAQTAAAGQPTDPMIIGKRVFNTCMACHQKDGEGVAGTYPPLAGSSILTGVPQVPIAIVLRGLEGPITVDGKPFNNSMPSWARFSDEQIAAVLTYARASFGNDATPVAPELVKAVREATSDRGQPWKAADLEGLASRLPSAPVQGKEATAPIAAK